MPDSPNGESRLDRIERLLELQARDHAKSMDDHDKRMKDLDARMEVLHVNIESLHASASELHASSQRHEAAIAALLEAAKRDGENIAALARIAESHERRLDDLEGGE